MSPPRVLTHGHTSHFSHCCDQIAKSSLRRKRVFGFIVCGDYLWQPILVCQLDVPGKRKSQLRNYLHQTGPWACLCGIFLIDAWGWQLSMNSTTLGHIGCGWIGKVQTVSESVSCLFRLVYWFLLQTPALRPHLGFPGSQSRSSKLTWILFPWVAFGQNVYQTNRRQTRTQSTMEKGHSSREDEMAGHTGTKQRSGH